MTIIIVKINDVAYEIDVGIDIYDQYVRIEACSWA
mgnify:CR=1 FL=1